MGQRQPVPLRAQSPLGSRGPESARVSPQYWLMSRDSSRPKTLLSLGSPVMELSSGSLVPHLDPCLDVNLRVPQRER